MPPLFTRRLLSRRRIASRCYDRCVSPILALLRFRRGHDRRRLNRRRRRLSRCVPAVVSLYDLSLDRTRTARATARINSPDLTLVRIYLERRTPAKHSRFAQLLIQWSVRIADRCTGRDRRRPHDRSTSRSDLRADLAVQLTKRRKDRRCIDGARSLRKHRFCNSRVRMCERLASSKLARRD